ncbi:MAG: TlpA disulfide reductase family protein [Chloroflexota bacterium]|nr:TlpA disulfide reductase family protein [Chloroflexota bacterium]
MRKARKGRLLPGDLILLGLLFLGLSVSGCWRAMPPAPPVPTETTKPGATTAVPVTATPTIKATPVTNSPTDTPLPADPTPTPPPVAPQEGFTAPDFSLPNLQGNVITLSEFRGQPVMVNFWTTWCPYCREEITALEETYYHYEDEGLVVLALNVQEPAETVVPFISAQGLTLPVLLDSDASTAMAYLTHAIPTTFFIDQRGVISVIHLGPLSEEAVETYLTDLLNEG